MVVPTHSGSRSSGRQTTRRFAARCLVLSASLVFAAGCVTTSPLGSFDSVEYLRNQYEERLGRPASDELPVPFEVDETVLAAAEGRISPAAGERDRVEQVTDFIFGWLGLDYALTPTRSAMGTFGAREGNCLSFVNLFVGLAREHRLAPFYVEVEDYQRWDYSEGSVVSHGHIVAGLRVDGKLETYDFLPYRPKSYRDFEPIDDVKAAAHYFNNLGAEALMRGDLERARELTGVAVELTPWFDKAVNNLGVTLLRQGEPEEALAVLEEGLEQDPENVALLTNAARAHQELGRVDEAEDLLARLDGVHHSNPFFYVYRGEVALARGDLEGALDYMRQAYRRDSEVPEVHLGLVKVYLAMGERQKALHHVERALQLDATHEQARSFATMLLGPTRGRR